MRCKAGAVYYAAKAQKLSREYGTWMLEWIDSVFGVTLAREPFRWGQKRLQAFFDGGRKEIIAEVEKYTADKMTVKAMGWRDATDAERYADGIQVAYEKMTSDLRAYGFSDYEFKQLEPADRFAEKWRKAGELMHAARRAWYELNGRNATRIYVAGTLLWLHDNCGFGAFRLEKVYEKAAPAIREYYERFFLASIAKDGEMRADLDALHAVLEERGIELIELEDEDRVEVKRKTENNEKLTSCKDIAEYDKILGEVKKSNMRYAR